MKSIYSKYSKIQITIGLSVFFGAAAALMLEIATSRMIAPVVGMSTYTWSTIIAVVLSGLSIGNWWGGRLADKEDISQTGPTYVCLAFMSASLSAILSLPMSSNLPSFPEGGLAVLMIVISIVFLPALAIGLSSPLLMRLALLAAASEQGRIIGRLYGLGALGSIVGTLASGYLFIPWVGTFKTVLFIAILLLFLALFNAIVFRRHIKIAIIATTAVGISILFTTLTGGFASKCTEESQYYCISVTDIDHSEYSGRAMTIDRLIHGANSPTATAPYYYYYIRAIDELVSLRFGRHTPLKAFFVGGGAYTPCPAAGWLAVLAAI